MFLGYSQRSACFFGWSVRFHRVLGCDRSSIHHAHSLTTQHNSTNLPSSSLLRDRRNIVRHTTHCPWGHLFFFTTALRSLKVLTATAECNIICCRECLYLSCQLWHDPDRTQPQGTYISSMSAFAIRSALY